MCGIWALLSSLKIKDFGKHYNDFMKIKHRGPEYSSFDLVNDHLLIGFHRLKIMDLTAQGNQPFHHVRDDGSCIYCICNGEIYNSDELKKKYDIVTESHSDCEVIIPLYEKIGYYELCKVLGSEFAFMIFDVSLDNNVHIYAGRDPIGNRPLFYGTDENTICLSSELKGINQSYNNYNVFEPGTCFHYHNGKYEIKRYYEYIYPEQKHYNIESEIRNKLIYCVEKRLRSDKPIGALLSGGLDSSLINGVIKYINPEIEYPLFTIVMKEGGDDLKYAKMVAKHLNLEHHVIKIDKEELLKNIDRTIYAIESWDITTVRASTLQYVISKKIKKYNIPVLFVGELADEVAGGYLYEYYAPTNNDFHNDCVRLVKDVHRFDGLRTDRSCAAHGIEVRTPFSDPEFIDFYMSLDVNLRKPNQDRMEKCALREAFDEINIIPQEVL